MAATREPWPERSAVTGRRPRAPCRADLAKLIKQVTARSIPGVDRAAMKDRPDKIADAISYGRPVRFSRSSTASGVA